MLLRSLMFTILLAVSACAAKSPVYVRDQSLMDTPKYQSDLEYCTKQADEYKTGYLESGLESGANTYARGNSEVVSSSTAFLVGAIAGFTGELAKQRYMKIVNIRECMKRKGYDVSQDREDPKDELEPDSKTE